MMNVAVTGSNGYLGNFLCEYLSQQGYRVRRLRRIPNADDKDGSLEIHWSLQQGINPDALEGLDALVHCAYDLSLSSWREISEVNVGGSIRLMDSASAVGVERIVFISTMSAFAGCESLYGRAKLEIEKEALRMGASVIRPGMIFGHRAGGVLGSLSKVVSQASIIPLIGDGRQMLHFSNINDLCHLIDLVVAQQISLPREPIIAASPNGKTFREVMRILARQYKKNLILIPIPWRFVWVFLKMVELSKIPIGFRSDSVISFVNLDPNPKFFSLPNAGVSFRDFSMEVF